MSELAGDLAWLLIGQGAVWSCAYIHQRRYVDHTRAVVDANLSLTFFNTAFIFLGLAEMLAFELRR